jgi:hypothetical protein
MLVGGSERWKDTKEAAKEALQAHKIQLVRGKVKDPFEERQNAAAALRIARSNFLSSSDDDSDEEEPNPNYDRNGFFKWDEAQGVAIASAQAKYKVSLQAGLFRDLLLHVIWRRQKERAMYIWVKHALGFEPLSSEHNPAKVGIRLDRRQLRAQMLAEVKQKKLPPGNQFMKRIDESPFTAGLALKKAAVTEERKGEPAELSGVTVADMVKGAKVYADWSSDYDRAEPPQDFEEVLVQWPAKRRDKRGLTNHWVLKFPDGTTNTKHISEIKIKREPAGVTVLRQAFLETQQIREREGVERGLMEGAEQECWAYLKALVMAQIEKDEESRRQYRLEMEALRMEHTKVEAEKLWWAQARERARMYEVQLYAAKREAMEMDCMRVEDNDSRRAEFQRRAEEKERKRVAKLEFDARLRSEYSDWSSDLASKKQRFTEREAKRILDGPARMAAWSCDACKHLEAYAISKCSQCGYPKGGQQAVDTSRRGQRNAGGRRRGRGARGGRGGGNVDAARVEEMRRVGDYKGLLQLVENYVVIGEYDNQEWRERTCTRAARRRVKVAGTNENNAFAKLIERSEAGLHVMHMGCAALGSISLADVQTVTFRQGRAGYDGCTDCWHSRRRFQGECNGISGDHMKVGMWRERFSGHAAGSGASAASIRATARANRKQCGQDPFVVVRQHALIRFDDIFHKATSAELGKLPRGPHVKVKSATLRLVVPADIPNSCGRSFSVHQMLVEWTAPTAYGRFSTGTTSTSTARSLVCSSSAPVLGGQSNGGGGAGSQGRGEVDAAAGGVGAAVADILAAGSSEGVEGGIVLGMHAVELPSDDCSRYEGDARYGPHVISPGKVLELDVTSIVGRWCTEGVANFGFLLHPTTHGGGGGEGGGGDASGMGGMGSSRDASIVGSCMYNGHEGEEARPTLIVIFNEDDDAEEEEEEESRKKSGNESGLIGNVVTTIPSQDGDITSTPSSSTISSSIISSISRDPLSRHRHRIDLRKMRLQGGVGLADSLWKEPSISIDEEEGRQEEEGGEGEEEAAEEEEEKVDGEGNKVGGSTRDDDDDDEDEEFYYPIYMSTPAPESGTDDDSSDGAMVALVVGAAGAPSMEQISNKLILANGDQDQQSRVGFSYEERQFYRGLSYEERCVYGELPVDERQIYAGLSCDDRPIYGGLSNEEPRIYGVLSNDQRRIYAGLSNHERRLYLTWHGGLSFEDRRHAAAAAEESRRTALFSFRTRVKAATGAGGKLAVRMLVRCLASVNSLYFNALDLEANIGGAGSAGGGEEEEIGEQEEAVLRLVLDTQRSAMVALYWTMSGHAICLSRLEEFDGVAAVVDAISIGSTISEVRYGEGGHDSALLSLLHHAGLLVATVALSSAKGCVNAEKAGGVEALELVLLHQRRDPGAAVVQSKLEAAMSVMESADQILHRLPSVLRRAITSGFSKQGASLGSSAPAAEEEEEEEEEPQEEEEEEEDDSDSDDLGYYSDEPDEPESTAAGPVQEKTFVAGGVQIEKWW